MTLLAGVYARRAGERLSNTLCESVERALSRHPNERVERFRDDRCFILKADIGAFGDRAVVVEPRAVSMLAGEPLLSSAGAPSRSRSSDLGELHAAWGRDSLEPLTRARGVFSAAHYRPETGTLVLVTDKLGIRPMYYWFDERFVVFATALRILEEIAEVPKVMDLRGVTEISTFGYALGARTPYASVELLMPAQVVRFEDGAASRREYWHWNDVKVSDCPVEELAADAYRTFTDAVAIRAGEDTTTAAFLSGGLDSRAIVSALRERGMHVHTFNFAPAGSQDQVFGAAFAERVGVTHVEAPMREGAPAWSMMMAEAWSASPRRSVRFAERPALVWSGDGGSVVLGHVYLKTEMIALARRGGAAAVSELLNRSWGGDVPKRLFRPQTAEALGGTARQGLEEELDRFGGGDAGRQLHLVLLANDQRRHLAEHFEGIDLHRLEFQLPFFDSEFVASVLRVPVDACVGHAFYMRWLRHFPAVVRSVPWQAYPGHEPCSLPIPAELAYQWERARSNSARDALRREVLGQSARMLRAPDFPHALMSRSYLRFATWLYRFRLRDLGYVIRTAGWYYRYWSRCGGRYVSPTRASALTERSRKR